MYEAHSYAVCDCRSRCEREPSRRDYFDRQRPADRYAATGGPAPKALVGTYTTKRTRAEIVSVPRPEFFPSQPRWKLVILNSAVGTSPRALGLNPVGSSGPAVPFGVAGKRIHLQCQTEDGVPTRGHSTFSWSLNGRTLTFKLVSLPCKSSNDRNQPVVLTSEPWHKVR